MRSAASTPRLIASAPAGLLVTAGMATIMYALISQNIPQPETLPTREIVFTRLIQNPEPPPRPTPEKPPEPVDPFVGPRGQVSPPTPGGREAPGELPGVFVFGPPTIGGGGGAPQVASQGPRLIFTPFAEYPQAMYPREGSCDVRFDVTALGATANIEVVSCTSSGFARAAEQAVSRALYHAAQGEAGPVATVGHMLTIDFKIEE